MKIVQPGQIWRVKNNRYELGGIGDISVILSLDQSESGYQWNIGCFWFTDAKHGLCGGARVRVLSSSEINDTGEYIGHITEIGKALHDLRELLPKGKEISSDDIYYEDGFNKGYNKCLAEIKELFSDEVRKPKV